MTNGVSGNESHWNWMKENVQYITSETLTVLTSVNALTWTAGLTLLTNTVTNTVLLIVQLTNTVTNTVLLIVHVS